MKILVINAGSSSLKYQLIDMETEHLLAKGLCERIGIDGHLKHTPLIGGKPVFDEDLPMPTHSEAIQTVLNALVDPQNGVISSMKEIDAVGHRVVHGGETFASSVLINDEVLKAVEDCTPLAPLHNPAGILGIEAARKVFGNIPMVAVFDTAFHSTMPPKAYMYAIPYEYYEKYGVRRYGFHGTSHFYVSHRCADKMGKPIEDLKLITCHLGNGSSVAAVDHGKVVDTSMGFTPLDGFMMGTRSGGVDPSVVTFMMKKLGLTPDEMDTILNKQSGVNAISGVSSDDRDICAAQNAGNKRASLAHEMQAYEIAKFIGSYIAAMNGVDGIVFTGGIGENGHWLRSRICSYLGYMGVQIDEKLNQATVKGAEAELTDPSAKVRVFILATDEELVIAQETQKVVESLQK